MIFKYFGTPLDSKKPADYAGRELISFVDDSDAVWDNHDEAPEHRYDVGVIIGRRGVPFKILVREEYENADREDVLANEAKSSSPIYVAIGRDVKCLAKGKYIIDI